MKVFKLALVAFAACSATLVATSCSSNDDEPAMARSISVDVYESIMPKGDADYSPKAWHAYTVSLYKAPASNVATEQTGLASGKLSLKDGAVVSAAYSSNTGMITGADYGTYTMVVLCGSSPTNGYLNGRWSHKAINYSEANSVYTDNCLFVWDDMQTHGGYYNWQTK